MKHMEHEGHLAAGPEKQYFVMIANILRVCDFPLLPWSVQTVHAAFKNQV